MHLTSSMCQNEWREAALGSGWGLQGSDKKRCSCWQSPMQQKVFEIFGERCTRVNTSDSAHTHSIDRTVTSSDTKLTEARTRVLTWHSGTWNWKKKKWSSCERQREQWLLPVPGATMSHRFWILCKIISKQAVIFCFYQLNFYTKGFAMTMQWESKATQTSNYSPSKWYRRFKQAHPEGGLGSKQPPQETILQLHAESSRRSSGHVNLSLHISHV